MSALAKPNLQPAKRRSRRRTRPSLVRRLSRHTKVFELSARLSINLILSGIAVTALGRLVPHLQTQTAQLDVVNGALAQVETSTAKLQSDFGRYFDPWQAQKIMQEQSGYRPSTERQVVWTEEDAAAQEATVEPDDQSSGAATSPDHMIDSEGTPE